MKIEKGSVGTPWCPAKEEQLNYVRESGYEKFGKLYEKIARGKHTVREYCQSLCEYMESQNFYADIMTKAEN